MGAYDKDRVDVDVTWTECRSLKEVILAVATAAILFTLSSVWKRDVRIVCGDDISRAYTLLALARLSDQLLGHIPNKVCHQNGLFFMRNPTDVAPVNIACVDPTSKQNRFPASVSIVMGLGKVDNTVIHSLTELTSVARFEMSVESPSTELLVSPDDTAPCVRCKQPDLFATISPHVCKTCTSRDRAERV